MTTTIAAAWEAFQLDGLAPRGVSADVVESWRRSRSLGLDPERPSFKEHDVSLESPFIRAAVPVMLEMARQLDGSDTCLALADPNGTIVWRWVGTPQLKRALSRVHVVERVQFSEDTLGTNGIGTALESKNVVSILGANHFCRSFHLWSCVAAPVFHPVTRRLCGAVNITCRAEQANQFLQIAIRAMTEDVRKELYSTATAGQKLLLDAYLARRTRTLAPLVAVNDKILISDELPFDQATLWKRVKDASPSARFLEVENGIAARVWPVTAGTFADGVVLELAPSSLPLDETPSAPEPSDLSPLEHAERRVILECLARHDGNKSHTADELRISRRSLYDKLHRYGIRI